MRSDELLSKGRVIDFELYRLEGPAYAYLKFISFNIKMTPKNLNLLLAIINLNNVRRQVIC